jgi:hypothetical protein
VFTRGRSRQLDQLRRCESARENRAAVASAMTYATRSSRPAGKSSVHGARPVRKIQANLVPHVCNWVKTAKCCEPVEYVFESSLGYCRVHAEAVHANRQCLQQFVARRSRTASPEAARTQLRGCVCGNGS